MGKDGELNLTSVVSNSFFDKYSSLEIIDDRDEFSRRYSLLNRATKRIIYGTPIHYFDKATNKYETIDTSLNSVNKSALNNKNTFKTVFDTDPTSNTAFQITKDIYGLSLKIVDESQDERSGKTTLKEVDGNSKFIVTKGENIKFEYRVLNKKVKDEIIIKGQQDVYKFEFDIELENLVVELNDNGVINLVDKTLNKTIFYIPRPFMKDDNGAICKEIECFITKRSDNSFRLCLMPDEKWLNDLERAFPVIIDPEIVEYIENPPFIVRAYQKVAVNNSGGTHTYWEEIDNEIIEFNSNYRLEIILNLENINIPLNDISSIILNTDFVGYGLMIINNLPFQFTSSGFDLSSLITTNFNFHFVVDFSDETNLYLGLHNSIYDAISFNIEYIIDEYGNAKRSIPLNEKINSTVNLTNGDLVFNIVDTFIKAGQIQFPIFHTYRRSNLKHNCGNRYNLNIHQNIKRIGENYFFFNKNGEYEKINEYFFYIINGEKIYVDKQHVDFSNEYELFIRLYGVSHKIYREQTTDSGLIFKSRLEGIKNIKYIDQRIDEEKEIEDYLKDCISSLKSLKLFNIDTASTVEFNVIINEELDNFASFLNNVSDSIYIFDEHSIFQYQVQFKDKENLELKRQERLDEDPNADTSDIDYQIGLISRQLDMLVESGISNKYKVETLYSRYLTTRKTFLTVREIIPRWYLFDGEINYGFNYLGKLCVIFDSYQNYFSIERGIIATENENEFVITKIYNDTSAVYLEYDYSGNLISLNNNGEIIKYCYSNGNLTGITFQNNEFVRMDYFDSGEILTIATSEQKCIDFSHDFLYRISQIEFSSFLNKIDISSESILDETIEYRNLSKYIYRNITVDYSEGRTIMNDNELSNVYYYDENKNIYFSCEINNGIYSNVLVEYFKNKQSLIRIIPKKQSEKIDNISTIDSELLSNLSEFGIETNTLINLFSKTNGQYANYGEAEYLIIDLDSKNRVTKEKGNWSKISDNKYIRNITDYYFDASNDAYPYIKKVVTHFFNSSPSNLNCTLDFKEIVERRYDNKGRLIREKSYVSGEETINGINIIEYEYDENGFKSISRSYNSLDSSSKLYEKNTFNKEGLMLAKHDYISGSDHSFLYDNEGLLIKENLPNGSKIGYGYDDKRNRNSISHSTEIGEENTINKLYKYNCLVLLKDTNNSILYEYDKKGRVVNLNYNGVSTTFTYAGSLYDSTSTIQNESCTREGFNFGSVNCDLVISNTNNVSLESFFDKQGRIVMEKEGNTIKHLCNYDESLLSREFIQNGEISSNGHICMYYYDFNKRLSQIFVKKQDSLILKESYSYDDDGNLEEYFFTIDNNPTQYKQNYIYSDDSRKILTGISMFDSYTISPLFDLNNRYVGRNIKNSSDEIIQKEVINYKKVGDCRSIFPCSVSYETIYDGTKSSSLEIKYKYDVSNNISEIFEDDILINKYYYDHLNRLIREDNKKLNKTYLFSYDTNGNIISKKEANFTLEKNENISDFNVNIKYLYEGDKLISFDEEEILYNQYSFPTNYRGINLSWDNNRLIQFGANTFEYDGLGRRVKKNNTSYLYDSNNRLIKSDNTNDVLIFAYDHLGVTGFKYNNEQYIYRKNVLGDVVSIISVSNNQMVASYVYDAWGNHIVLDSNNEIITNHSHIGFINPFRYRSYYFDDETGLYYLKTRYYDPQVCRFISIDSLEFLNETKVGGLNLFIYCLNNPIMYSDPRGNSAEESWQYLIAGIFVILVVLGIAIASSGFGGAVIGVLAGAFLGGLFGGLKFENGSINWDWNGAAKGFMWGAVTGALSGFIGGALAGVGNTIKGASTLGKGIYCIIQGGINSVIAGGLKALQGVTTDSFSWKDVGIASIFGLFGGGLSPLTNNMFGQFLIAVGITFIEETVSNLIDILISLFAERTNTIMKV